MIDKSQWYLVRCKPREDTRALENLERQGFTCYLPFLTLEKLRRRRKMEVKEPLFPGYLFINLDKVHDNWHCIRSTRGVIQIVRFAEDPVPVPDPVIQAIRDRTSCGPRLPLFEVGERLLITEGCFADLEAIYIANDGNERVMLLIKILQHDQTLSFPVGSIRKVATGRA